jgi:hypothetical protein
MNTKKQYMEPEMKTVELTMPSALLAGSGASLISPTSGITGDGWDDNDTTPLP